MHSTITYDTINCPCVKCSTLTGMFQHESESCRGPVPSPPSESRSMERRGWGPRSADRTRAQRRPQPPNRPLPAAGPGGSSVPPSRLRAGERWGIIAFRRDRSPLLRARRAAEQPVCHRLGNPRPKLDIDLKAGDPSHKGRAPGLGWKTQVGWLTAPGR